MGGSPHLAVCGPLGCAAVPPRTDLGTPAGRTLPRRPIGAPLGAPNPNWCPQCFVQLRYVR
eukprot:334998-Chlamydomonas_euryale.AAC.8